MPGAVLDCAKTEDHMDIIGQVWTGRAGLARTYWLYGIVASFAWGIALSAVTPGSLAAKFVVGLLLCYYVIVNVGIWRSASQYDGPKVWAVLAKIAVAALPVLFIVGIIAAVSITSTKPTEAIDWEKGVITPPPNQSQ